MGPLERYEKEPFERPPRFATAQADILAKRRFLGQLRVSPAAIFESLVSGAQIVGRNFARPRGNHQLR